MRIASLSPAATEILYKLGMQNQIVCVDRFSNFPEDAIVLPHCKDHVRISAEELRKHEPELVLTGTVIQEKLAEELRAAGYAVVHQDPRTINAIYESIRTLGALLQRGNKAEELVLTMQQGFTDVKKKAALLPRRLRVYIEEWHEPPFVSANWVPEVARIAGVDQFPVRAGELSPEVTLRQVQGWDPDFIVMSWCGAGLTAEPQLLTGREGWDALRAVRNNAVRVIDDSLLNRPGPQLVDGARHLYGWAFEFLH